DRRIYPRPWVPAHGAFVDLTGDPWFEGEPEEVEDPSECPLLVHHRVLVLHKEHAGIRVETQIEVELVPKVPVQTGALLGREILPEQLAEQAHRLCADPLATGTEPLGLTTSDPRSEEHTSELQSRSDLV